MLRSTRSSLGLFGLASLLLLAFCASCGDSAQVDDARYQWRIGNLESAERLLEGAESPAAAELRADIARVRQERRELDTKLESLAMLAPQDERAELEGLLAAVSDPVSRERIEVAISSSVDRAAEERVGGGARSRRTGGGTLSDLDEELRAHIQGLEQERAGADDLDLALATIGALLDEAQWSQALAEVEMSLPVAGKRVEEFRARRRDLLDGSFREAYELLAQAERLDEAGDLGAASELVGAALPRFPEAAGGGSLREALSGYEDRLEILAEAERATSVPAPQPPRVDEVAAAGTPSVASGDPLLRAAALERGGDLSAALDAYLEAGLAALPGMERDGLIARARGVERRLTLRSEILAARAVDPERFEQELGLVGGDTTLLMTQAGPKSWDAWPIEKLQRAASLSNVSQEAELGLLSERLLRGDSGGRSGALASLARLVKEGAIDPAGAWELVASERGEPVPEGGYVWEGGTWISKQDQLDSQQKELLASLEKRFSKAKDLDEREDAWDALADLGPAAFASRTKLLESRWERALQGVLKGSTLQALGRVAQEREELDHRREQALALIFDEEEYFYPYRPPECPPDKARLYWPVQQRVDELVAAVREVWNAAKPVKLSTSFRSGLADLAWASEAGEELGLELELPAEIPKWAFSLAEDLDEVGLHEFAWDETEADELAYNRSVEAYNRRRWADQKALKDEERAEKSEQRQVEVTNEYRKMFGRRALAWNSTVQVAADMHSQYMADTGDFGHFEKGDPDRRSPFDRMRLAGYNSGASENCLMGNGSPEGAHDGWIHSSGHHRNILMPGHREMASAMTSSYWTQNYGTGSAFKADLDSWQD